MLSHLFQQINNVKLLCNIQSESHAGKQSGAENNSSLAGPSRQSKQSEKKRSVQVIILIFVLPLLICYCLFFVCQIGDDDIPNVLDNVDSRDSFSTNSEEDYASAASASDSDSEEEEDGSDLEVSVEQVDVFDTEGLDVEAQKANTAPTAPIPKYVSNSYPGYATRFYTDFRREIGTKALLAKCRLCTEANRTKVDIKADVQATSNWLKHLRRVHSKELTEYEEKKQNTPSTASTPSNSRQPHIDDHFSKPKNCGAAFATELDMLLTLLFTVDNAPLNLLTKNTFKTLLKVNTFLNYFVD